MTRASAGKNYQIGVIGCGARAEVFARHLATGVHPRASLFGLCDVDDDRLRKFCDFCEIGDTRLFTDPARFFNEPGLNAVIITTPEFAHRDNALAAMKAGKHIYLEKAMAPNVAQCREIIRAHEKSGIVAFLGFNAREIRFFKRIKEIVQSGILGRIVHISMLEQLTQAHGASFMRRFHRHSRNSGGMLNTKCCHHLDLMQWIIGHQHKVARVASFGGTNVFLPQHGPPGHGKFCSECPEEIHRACPYKDRAGFVFPVRGDKPIHKTRQLDVYGGDLCVYSDDKDLVDNQTVILEWDNGVRGDFNLKMFQHSSKHDIRVWGEKGVLETYEENHVIRVRLSDTGEVIEHVVKNPPGGHGGADNRMLNLFVNAMDRGELTESGLHEGLAATLLAEKADESRRSGKIVEIAPDEYR